MVASILVVESGKSGVLETRIKCKYVRFGEVVVACITRDHLKRKVLRMWLGWLSRLSAGL